MSRPPLSLDEAVWGFLRHRFVRAMVAAAIVFTALNVLVGAIVLVTELFLAIDYDWLFDVGLWSARGRAHLADVLSGALSSFFGALTNAALITALITPLVAFLLVLGDIVHHRIVGFVVSISIALALIIGVVVVAGFASNAADQGATLLALIMVLMPGFVMLFGIEAMAWASWQFTTPSKIFHAARGWRPPLWPLAPALRARIGLPGFISNYGKGQNTLIAIYSLLALLNVGLLAPVVAPFLISAIGNAEFWLTRIVAGVYLAFLLLNFVGLRPLLNRWARNRAAQLYQDAREWDARPPVVFLRPFEQDATRLPAITWDPLVKLASGDVEARTLDELLLEHGSIYGPVIAIGDPRDPTPPLGAARIFVEGAGMEWQRVVTSLVEASKVVVLCPSTSEGIQWEIDLIARLQSRMKIVLLANPALTPQANAMLVERFAPGVAGDLKPNQALVAAYNDEGAWRVVSSAKPASVQTYTMGLNLALQSLLGCAAVPLPETAAAPERAARAA